MQVSYSVSSFVILLYQIQLHLIYKVANKSSNSAGDRSGNIAAKRIFAASTILAVVISVPAIAVAVVTYYIFKTSLLITLLSSIITLFVAMGLGYKISNKLTKYQNRL